MSPSSSSIVVHLPAHPLLHAAGFGIAALLRAQAARLPLRLGGLVMAAIGGYLLAA